MVEEVITRIVGELEMHSAREVDERNGIQSGWWESQLAGRSVANELIGSLPCTQSVECKVAWTWSWQLLNDMFVSDGLAAR